MLGTLKKVSKFFGVFLGSFFVSFLFLIFWIGSAWNLLGSLWIFLITSLILSGGLTYFLWKMWDRAAYVLIGGVLGLIVLYGFVFVSILSLANNFGG